jgi:hypothetical protein
MRESHTARTSQNMRPTLPLVGSEYYISNWANNHIYSMESHHEGSEPLSGVKRHLSVHEGLTMAIIAYCYTLHDSFIWRTDVVPSTPGTPLVPSPFTLVPGRVNTSLGSSVCMMNAQRMSPPRCRKAASGLTRPWCTSSLRSPSHHKPRPILYTHPKSSRQSS